MRHDPVDILGRIARTRERGMGGFGQFFDRMAEHFAPFHPQMARGLCLRDTTIDIKQITKLTI